MTDVRWIEVTARVALPDVELVADALRSRAEGGVVIEPAIRTSDRENFRWEPLDEPSLLRACFPAPFDASDRRDLRRRLATLPLSAPLPRLRYVEVGPRDWAEQWKRFYHPIHAGERIVVRPSWEAYEAAAGELVVELDPGEAFGTGQHETTRLCLRALEGCVDAEAAVIDVGAGSGILAIAAARLGARSVRAVDSDPATVEIARRNVAMNDVASTVRCAAGSLGATWPFEGSPQRSAGVVVANISSVAIVELMPELAAALRDGGTLVASGFIARDAGMVRDAAGRAGLRELELLEENDWRCLVARQPDPGA